MGWGESAGFVEHLSRALGERPIDCIVRNSDGAFATREILSHELLRDNAWTRAARLRSGDGIKVHLFPWDDYSAQYEKFTRSELEDASPRPQDPLWGELME